MIAVNFAWIFRSQAKLEEVIIARMKVDDDETFPTENEGEDEQKEQVFKDSKTFLKVSLWLHVRWSRSLLKAEEKI